MSLGPPLSQRTTPSFCPPFIPPLRLTSRTARRIALESPTSFCSATERIDPITSGAPGPAAGWESRSGGSTICLQAGSTGKTAEQTPSTHTPPPAALRQSCPVVHVAASEQKPSEHLLPTPKSDEHCASLVQSSWWRFPS